MLVKAFSFVWLTLAAVALIRFFVNSHNTVWKWAVVVTLSLVLMYSLIWIPWRRKRRGFHVYKRGGAEGGILYYTESDRVLRFYFDRTMNTIFIPSDTQWREVTPIWAHDRKQEIVERIRKSLGQRLIGKNWNYEETNNAAHIVAKD